MSVARGAVVCTMKGDATFPGAADGGFTVTSEMQAAFDDCGYILVRDLLSKEEIQHLRSAIEHPKGVISHGYGRQDGAEKKFQLTLWQHPGVDVTGVAARINKIAGTMEQLLGGDEIYHYHSKVIMKEAKTGGPKVWHQDYGYWYSNGCLMPEMGTVFVPLDPCLEENGCLQVLPGTHLLGRQDHVAMGQQLGTDPVRLQQIMERYPVRFVEMAPGDVLFFHCNLLHGSAANTSDKRRYVFISSYNKKINNPVIVHHHPQYTPMEKLDDGALLRCSVVDNMDGKDFMLQDSQDTYQKFQQEQLDCVKNQGKEHAEHER